MNQLQIQLQNNCYNRYKTVTNWLLDACICFGTISVHHHKTPEIAIFWGFLLFATTIATKYGLNKGRKYPYKEAKLVHGKRAYIEFYAFSESLQALKRKTIFCPAKFKTVAMIERWANNILPELNRGLENGFHFKDLTDTEPAPANETPRHKLTDVLEVVIKVKNGQLRSKTAGTYQTAYKKFTGYLTANNRQNIYADEFTPANAYQYRDYLLITLKNSNRTVNNNMIWIRSFFEGALERGYIKINPINVKSLPETDSDQHEVFTVEHQALIESYLKENDFEMYVFTRVLYYAFIRPNELRGITFAHIDMTKRVINVPGKIAKNRRTETIPLSQSLYGILLDFSKNVLSGMRLSGSNTFFLFGKGMIPGVSPMSINYAYERHKRALIACGLDGFNYTLYCWKHTGASRAYEVTKDILRLSKLLRHASTKETENYLRSIGVRLKSESLDYDW